MSVSARVTIEELASRTGLSVADAADAIADLKAKGLISEEEEGCFKLNFREMTEAQLRSLIIKLKRQQA